MSASNYELQGNGDDASVDSETDTTAGTDPDMPAMKAVQQVKRCWSNAKYEAMSRNKSYCDFKYAERCRDRRRSKSV